MAEPHPDMLGAALAAWDAGLCVIKAKADGSKRPFTSWTEYQAERPSREQVTEWFRDGWPAMGAVCGAVSGDLEMLELEGRFVAEYTTAEFSTRMKDAGLELLLRRLTKDGMLTVSPSDGRHFLYRVQGTVAGNSKLAVRKATAAELLDDPKNATKTLIETRGEGGFVMLAPSHGTTHPTGKPWMIKTGTYRNIPTITAEERDALWEVARSFQDPAALVAPPPPPPARKVTVRRHTGALVGSSYYDAVTEHLKATTSVRHILEAHGWTYEYTDRHGRDMLKRPGKDTDGISASINENGRLLLFSTSTSFTAYSGPGAKTPTYDELDVLAMYEYGNNRSEAAKAIAEQTGIMDAYKRAKDAESAAVLSAVLDAPNPQPRQEAQAQAQGINTVTGEMDAPLVDDLWEQRDVFRHIRDAARSRLVSPYAVLGCVLARVAAFTPPTVTLPPIIGGTAPLSLYVALHGASGDGKSSPVECAASLIPHKPDGCRGPLPMGSGEGFIEAFIERTEEKDENNKVKRGFKQVAWGILFELDEGEFLTDVGSRKGSTIMPILRSAWSGKEIGQTNASTDTKRHLAAKRYHIGLVSLWQEDAGLSLLADATGGTPQRFVWIPTADRTLERELIEWPGPLDWEPPTINRMGDTWFHQEMSVPEEIKAQIRSDRWDILQRVTNPNPLDSHRNLNKLKLSGVLAVLDGRRDISHDDWRLAERIMSISDAVRDALVDRGKTQAVEQVRVEAVKHSFREAILEQSATERALKNAARAAWKCASTAADGATRRDISRRIASRDRALVSVDDAIAYALTKSWIEGNDTVNYRPGEAQPA